MDTTTPYDGTALAATYNCYGKDPASYVWLLGHFETRACSRCGGGGHYSWCSMYGSRCFGCGGAGFQFTKRGAAALALYKALQSRPVANLAPGTPVYDRDSRRCTLASQETAPRTAYDRDNGTWYEDSTMVLNYTLQYKNDTHGWQGMALDSMLRVRGWDAVSAAAQLQTAMRYQAALTQQGVPRKASGLQEVVLAA